MNEKLQYATMLDIPISTTSVSPITKKRKTRKKKRVNDELVKAELLKKVNSEQDLKENLIDSQETSLVAVNNQNDLALQEGQELVSQEIIIDENTSNVFVAKNKGKKSPFKITVVGVQLVIIGVLVMAIFLTNALYKDSGINVFLRGVFGTESTVVDTREYSEFSPVISMGDNNGVMVSNGVITFAGEGSVYAPCDGIVKSISVTENGRYNIEIEHSQNFKSTILDVEHIYVNEGDIVYGNIPVGYLESDGASMCFTNGSGEVLDDYEIVGNMVVWQE